MTDLQQKFNLLDHSIQQEVLNFIDSPLSIKKKQSFMDWGADWQRILKIPLWSGKYIEGIERQDNHKA